MGLGDQEWHLFDETDLFNRLQTSQQGLSQEEATRRLEVYGKNELTPPKKMHIFLKWCLSLVKGF